MAEIMRCLNCLEKKGSVGVCSLCGVDDRNPVETANAMAPGTILAGRYLVGRLLGAGGFGNTYLALDLNLETKMAIKEYLPSGLATRRGSDASIHVFSGDAQSQYAMGLEKFVDEAKTLVKFNKYVGIVSISDFFHENSTAYIVMEYVDGITLKQYLKQKGSRLPVEQVLEIMRPVMDALRAVHEVGILHRDISPDNIYITADRQVKLLDFGAARQVVGEASKSLSVILKPGYAPEEQYRTRGKQGAWTDVYAVAATMYHCMSGVLPPDALDRFDDDELQPLERLVPGVPKPVNEALMKGLALRAGERWQTIREFQQALGLQGEAKPGGQQVTVVEPAEGDSPEKTVPLYFKPSTKANDQTGASERRSESGQHTGAVKSSGSAMVKRKSKSMVWLAGIGTLVIATVILAVMFAGSGSQDAKPPVEDEPVAGTSAKPRDGKPDLQIGDYVQFGKYYGKPIKWRVIHEDGEGNPVLFSDKILTIKAFDAAGSFHKDPNLYLTGSNNYENSNLRQWLNSEESVIKWRQNRPTAENMWEGRARNPYADEKGFLVVDNFTSKERRLIKSFSHKVLMANNNEGQADGGSEWYEYEYETPDKALTNYDSAYYKNSSDKVFLLSVKQLKEWVYDQRETLGEEWYIGEPTAEAVENSYKEDRLQEGEKWYYWLNTPYYNWGATVLYVNSIGGIRGNPASDDGAGVRPALQLNLSSAIFNSNGDGNESTPYVVEAE